MVGEPKAKGKTPLTLVPQRLRDKWTTAGRICVVPHCDTGSWLWEKSRNSLITHSLLSLVGLAPALRS